MGKNREHGGRQQGPQDHAIGEPGPLTRAANKLRIMSRRAADDAAGRDHERHDPAAIRTHDKSGGNRLFEGRRQHDVADENSDRTRRARDVDRHKHGPQSPRAKAAHEASAKRKN